MDKRYFIIGFSYLHDRGYGLGQTTLVTDGCYPNEPTIMKRLKAVLKDKSDDIEIINITELNESDYNDWNSL